MRTDKRECTYGVGEDKPHCHDGRDEGMVFTSRSFNAGISSDVGETGYNPGWIFKATQTQRRGDYYMNCPECEGWRTGPMELGFTTLGNPSCSRCGYVRLPNKGEWLSVEHYREPIKKPPHPTQLRLF